MRCPHCTLKLSDWSFDGVALRQHLPVCEVYPKSSKLQRKVASIKGPREAESAGADELRGEASGSLRLPTRR